MTTIDTTRVRLRPVVRPARRPSAERVAEAVVAGYLHDISGGRRRGAAAPPRRVARIRARSGG